MGEKLKKCHVLVNQFHGIFILKPLVVGELNMFSGIQNDASMHREGLRA